MNFRYWVFQSLKRLLTSIPSLTHWVSVSLSISFIYSCLGTPLQTRILLSLPSPWSILLTLHYVSTLLSSFTTPVSHILLYKSSFLFKSLRRRYFFFEFVFFSGNLNRYYLSTTGNSVVKVVSLPLRSVYHTPILNHQSVTSLIACGEKFFESLRIFFLLF